MSLPRNLWFLCRHPRALPPLLTGARFRDLVHREDLARLGIAVTAAEARGLSEAHLSVRVVKLLRERLGDSPPRTFLDVGAAHGGYSLAALFAFPGIRAFAFEPLPDVFAVLRESVRRRSDLTAFNFALGPENSRQTLHRSRSTGSSSFLEMNPAHEEHFPGTGNEGTEEVEVRALDDLVAEGEIELTGPTLMKIDVQGFEDRVFAGAKATLDQVDALIVEMSLTGLYEGQILMPELTAKIEARGFAYQGPFTEGRSVKTGEVVQVDGLFTRR